MSATWKCCYCGKGEPEQELRPYGPGGKPVCFPCAMTPERKDETRRQTAAAFGRAEHEAGPGGIVEIGGRRGLRVRKAVQ